MIVNRCTKALGAGVLAIVMLAAMPAEAIEFHVRNCTKERILICSYNADNATMWIAASVKSIEPNQHGDLNRSACN